MSYAAILFNIVAGLVYTPWMIQQIGRSRYGLYTLTMSVIGFFTMDFGLDQAVARFLAKYNVTGEKDKVRDFLGITFKLYMVIDILIFLVMLFIFLFADKIYAELKPGEMVQFKAIFVIAALYSVVAFPFTPLRGILVSSERFAFLKFTQMFQKILTVVSIIAVLLLGYGLYALVIVNVLTGLITISLKLGYLIKNRLISVNFKTRDKTILRSIVHYSFWITVVFVAERFILNITPTILGAFASSVQISLFAIAWTIGTYTWTFANALNGLFLPKVTRLSVNNGGSGNVENLMIRVGRIQLATTGFLIIAFLTMGKEFMFLWLGAGFRESYYITVFLIITLIITVTQQIGSTTLLVENKVKYESFCSIITAVISISLSLFFSRLYGAIGAAVSIFAGTFVGKVIGLNLVYHRVLKINIFRFFRECHLKMAFPLIVTFVAGMYLQYLIPVQKLPLFLVKCCMLWGVYLTLMWFTALNQYEKNLFTEILRIRRTGYVQE